MRNIIDIYEGVFDKSNASNVGKQLETQAIQDKIMSVLKDKEKYFFDPRFENDPDYFTIYKKGNKWFVDVNGWIVVYANEITDGSFYFGNIANDFTVIPKVKDGLKSLQYGPHTVKGSFKVVDALGLNDLKGCPKTVYDNVEISKTGITTLKYFPTIVAGSVYIQNNEFLVRFHDTKRCTVSYIINISDNGGKVERKHDINWISQADKYRFW